MKKKTAIAIGLSDIPDFRLIHLNPDIFMDLAVNVSQKPRLIDLSLNDAKNDRFHCSNPSFSKSRDLRSDV